ncbi:endonuclease V [Salininema proteolyticum]|uniref:Endonuclease V n=1 Tax=Salininema proteolyticum TaxID=1607685 RepID=A0ABV8TWT8_9ACTN
MRPAPPPVDASDPVTVQRYKAWQRTMHDQVRAYGDPDVATVAGFDVQYGGQGEPAVAAAVVLSYPDSEIVDETVVSDRPGTPYRPGLLALRELPLLLALAETLETLPDVVFCDGHGVGHPRGFGLACHLGLALDLPVVGIAKNPPYRDGIPEPGPGRGDTADIAPAADWDECPAGPVIGRSVRTRDSTKPVYVSAGHKISLDKSVELVLGTATRFRQPEPIRAADRLARAERKKLSE